MSSNVIIQTIYSPWLRYWVLPIILISFVFRIRRAKASLPLPPGPKGLPLLRNIFDIPRTLEHLTYAEWGRKYGDVVYITALGREFIILNSVKAANDLLDERSAIYSDRPHLSMLHDPDLMDVGYALSMKPYSRSWKRHRRILTQYLSPTAVTRLFSHRQTSAVHTLLNTLMNTSENIADALLQTSTSIVLGATYGYDTQAVSDPFVILTEKVIVLTGEGVGPKYFVNIFPALKYIPAWVPGNRFKPFAQHVAKLNKEMIEMGFSRSMEQLAAGKYTPSLVQTGVIELPEAGDPETKQDIKEVAAQMYAAGVGTTVAMIHFLILQLVLHPEIQERAHADLDSVIGLPSSPSFRLPTFDDRPSLPYIDALLTEVLRWMPAAPTGVPHATLEEDEYRGWRIPKGAIVIPNAWGMQRDETIYSNPSKFSPERFLGNGLRAAEPEPIAAFGFGRRVCPGRFLALTTLWLEVACLLAAFNFEPAKDSSGKPIDVRYAEEPIPLFVVQCRPFPCSITPRSKHVETVVRELGLYKLSG